MSIQGITDVQYVIGYIFKNSDLLHQAFDNDTESSVSKNEPLCILGERVLELIALKNVYSQYCSWAKDKPKFDFVNGRNDLMFNDDSEVVLNVLQKLISVSNLASRIDSLHLSELLICDSELKKDKTVKSNLFKAIIGAVAIDSGSNFDELEDVVDIMLFPDLIVSRKVNGFVENIIRWTNKKYASSPECRFMDTSKFVWYNPFNDVSVDYEDGRYWRYICILKLGEYEQSFKTYGETKKESRRNAFKAAYEHLKEKGLLLSLQEEVGPPDRERAVSQLRRLYMMGYINEPLYDYFPCCNEKGESMWRCCCRITGDPRRWWKDYKTKAEGKKSVAYDMLCACFIDSERHRRKGERNE